MWKLFAVLMLVCVSQAKAHEAPAGWIYDYRCCGNNDCSVATKVEDMPDGSLRVTTKWGTATYPRDYPRAPSQDSDYHAYFSPADPKRLYCLYVPAGV